MTPLPLLPSGCALDTYPHPPSAEPVKTSRQGPGPGQGTASLHLAVTVPGQWGSSADSFGNRLSRGDGAAGSKSSHLEKRTRKKSAPLG